MQSSLPQHVQFSVPGAEEAHLFLWMCFSLSGHELQKREGPDYWLICIPYIILYVHIPEIFKAFFPD